MISDKLQKKYFSLNYHDLNQEFESLVKKSKYENVKFFVENKKVKLKNESIEYGLFLSCVYNDVRMFKYLMFKQAKINLNTPKNWIDCLKNSCSQSKQEVLTYILKYPDKPIKFTEEHFYKPFLNTDSSINSLLYLVEKNLIDLKKFIYLNNSQYLQNLVQHARIDIIEYLAYKHEVSFTQFKDLAQSVKEKYRGNITIEIIDKQNAQELFAELNNNLDSKIKNKSLKI